MNTNSPGHPVRSHGNFVRFQSSGETHTGTDLELTEAGFTCVVRDEPPLESNVLLTLGKRQVLCRVRCEPAPPSASAPVRVRCFVVTPSAELWRTFIQQLT